MKLLSIHKWATSRFLLSDRRSSLRGSHRSQVELGLRALVQESGPVLLHHGNPLGLARLLELQNLLPHEQLPARSSGQKGGEQEAVAIWIRSKRPVERRQPERGATAEEVFGQGHQEGGGGPRQDALRYYRHFPCLQRAQVQVVLVYQVLCACSGSC